jgi:hypothetical protein
VRALPSCGGFDAHELDGARQAFKALVAKSRRAGRHKRLSASAG